MLIESGEDVVRVSRALGHASVAITLRVYSHEFESHPPEADERTLAAIEKFTGVGNPVTLTPKVRLGSKMWELLELAVRTPKSWKMEAFQSRQVGGKGMVRTLETLVDRGIMRFTCPTGQWGAPTKEGLAAVRERVTNG